MIEEDYDARLRVGMGTKETPGGNLIAFNSV